MKVIAGRAAALLGAILWGTCGTEAAAVTPVQKVIELLDGMLAKAKSAKKAEEVQWSAYKQFCTDSELEKQAAVKAANLQIEVLEADILKYDSEVARLERAIAGHEADIVTFKANIENATADREAEHAEYETLHADYSESNYAIAEAIKVLKEKPTKVPQASSLLQRVNVFKHVPVAARRQIQAFLEQDPEKVSELVDPPIAYAYESQAGGVITLLEDLKVKFRDETVALEKDEMEKKHAYDVLVHDFSASIAAAENEVTKKSEAKAENKQHSVDASAQLAEVTATRDADVAYLDDLDTGCNMKQKDFQDRQSLRAEEITGITKALDILSGSVAPMAAKHLPAAIQKSRPHGVSFLQTQRRKRQQPGQEQATQYLRLQSERIGSHILAALTMRVQDQPFDKVKGLIEELIARLQDEAAQEADHKQWCDDELDTNLQTRTTKTEEVNTLHSTIEQLTTEVAVLKKDIAALSEAVAQLSAEMAKAQELRSAEQATNEETIADAVGAQMATAEAVKILKDFYGTAAQATALVSVKDNARGQAPPIFEKSYKGLQKDHDNVVSFLEVIQSDFARLEGETQAAEHAADEQFTDYMSAATADKTQKQQDISDKTAEEKSKTQDLMTAEHDLELAQKELDAALDYYDKLKPSCLIDTSREAGAAMFDERVQRRNEEIAALKECLSILNGQTITGAMTNPDPLYSSVDGGNRGMDVGVMASP